MDAAKAPLPFISGAFAPLPCLKRTAGTFLHGAPLSRKSKTFAGKRRIRSKGGLLSDQGKRSKIDRGSVRAFGQSIQTKSFQIFRIRCFVTNLKCPALRRTLQNIIIQMLQPHLFRAADRSSSQPYGLHRQICAVKTLHPCARGKFMDFRRGGRGKAGALQGRQTLKTKL